MSEARRRVVEAAMRCFGSKGYAATTIADIEEAAGLARGGGGTYRHFASKQAILEAVIDAIVAAPDEELAPPDTDLEGSAHASLAYMTPGLTRMFFRDLDDFPEQRERIVDRMVTGPYRIVAERIRAQNPSVDADAVAAVLLGSIVNFRVIEVLIGEGRNGVDADRFVTAWASIYRATLEPDQPAAKKPAKEPTRKPPRRR